MTELTKTIGSPMPTDTTTAQAGITIDVSSRWIRRLMVVNLGLAALQPLSAGFFLSGYGRAATVHAAVALALQLGALVQAVTAFVQWRRRRAPAWVAGFSVGLLVIVFLQVGLGYNRRYWLHVPLGVGIFSWLTRQVNRLDT